MESNSERNQSLVEAKREYTEALCDSLAIPMYEGVRSIFEDGTKDCKPEDKLVEFQLQLKKIPQWNQNIVESETNRIMGRCSQDQDYLRNLITGLMVVNTKIFSVVKLNNASTNIDLRVPGTQSFLHNCYISCAREFYKNPYLFDDSKDGEAQLRNMREAEELIKKCIVSAIRKMTPISDITRRHIEGGVNGHGEIDTNLLTSDMIGGASKKEDKDSEDDHDSGSEDEDDEDEGSEESDSESEDELDDEDEDEEEIEKEEEKKSESETKEESKPVVEEVKTEVTETVKEVEPKPEETPDNKKTEAVSKKDDDESSDIVLDENDVILEDDFDGKDEEDDDLDDHVNEDTNGVIKMTVSKKVEPESKSEIRDDVSDTSSTAGDTIITKSNEVMKSSIPNKPIDSGSDKLTRKVSAKVPNYNLLTNNPHKKPKLFTDDDISDNEEEEEELEEEEDEYE